MLNDNELLNIDGGKTNYSLFVAAVGVVTFIIGVIDGYLRPLKCN